MLKKDIIKLRSIAQTTKKTHQIGKEGLHKALIEDILSYIDKHEIIKITILKNCYYSVDEVINILNEYNLIHIQTIGRNLIFYKKNNKLKQNIL